MNPEEMTAMSHPLHDMELDGPTRPAPEAEIRRAREYLSSEWGRGHIGAAEAEISRQECLAKCRELTADPGPRSIPAAIHKLLWAYSVLASADKG